MYEPPPTTLRDADAGAVRCAGLAGDELLCSAAFARACFAGLLRVQLLQYGDLPRHARCTLECADAEAACTLGSFGDVVLPLQDAAMDTLRLRLRARAGAYGCLPMGGDDEPRGSAQVPLSRLRDGKRRTLLLQLRGPGGGGSLRIALQLLPLPDAARSQGRSGGAPASAKPSAYVHDYPGGPLTERWSYEPLCFISHGVTDTQAAMWRSRRGCTVVLAFRGTEPGNVRDVVTDLRTSSVTMARFDFADGASEPLAHARVHAGFQDAYASVRHRVRSALDAAIRQGKPATLLITGHSLGGALATFCAVDVAESWAQTPEQRHQRPRIVLHTFGSPRVGDATFVSRLAVHVPTALRFVTGLDLVPSAPLVAMGYAHAGTGVHLPHADAPQAAVAAHLPGVEYERPPGEVAAAAASGLGVLHHLMGSYHAALERQLEQRESMS